MSHLTFIRHGQANSAARDEESYDRLSPLGHQQSAWLGEHLTRSGQNHALVYSGTLNRHIETAQSMGFGDSMIKDHRLNELPYFTLATLLEEQQGLAMPVEREGFVAHLPRVFAAWQRDEIKDVPERFADFETRIADAIAEIAGQKRSALVVTSGGLISMVMRQMMGLDIAATARMALAIMNTSVHRLYPIGAELSPVLFNAVPHLELPERSYAQTHF